MRAADLRAGAFNLPPRGHRRAGRGIGMDVVRSERLPPGAAADHGRHPGRHAARGPAAGRRARQPGRDRAPCPLELWRACLRPAMSFEDGGETCRSTGPAALWKSSLRRRGDPWAASPGGGLLRSASARIGSACGRSVGNQEGGDQEPGPPAGAPARPDRHVRAGIGRRGASTTRGPGPSLWDEGACPHEQAKPVRGGRRRMPALAARGLLGPLVLVVDDSITVRRVTQRLLQREGYRVALAADGLQAMERLAEERPTLVLSDIEMPRMDGFDLLRNIRADDALHDLPVGHDHLAHARQKQREMVARAGANHYLGKPYSDEELLGLIRSTIVARGSYGAARRSPLPAVPEPRVRMPEAAGTCPSTGKSSSRCSFFFKPVCFDHAVAGQRALARSGMVYDGMGVVRAQRHTGLGQLQWPRLPGRVAQRGRQACQLGHIALDEACVGVELPALRDRVEDAEPGLGVAARGGRPLPAAVVGGQVEVVELAREPGLAPAPVDPQVLDQEAGRHHAQAVVHIARGVELAHGGIDQRIAGAALAPGGEQRIGLGAGIPLDGVVGGLEAGMHHVRMVGQDLQVEVAPDQFGQPGGRAFARGALLHLVCLPGQPPPGGGWRRCRSAGARSARRRAGSRPSSFLGALPCPWAGAAPSSVPASKPIPLPVTMARRSPCRTSPGPGRCGRITLGWVGGQKEGRDLAQPGVLSVNHRNGHRPGGQHLVARKDHVVLEAVQGHALGGQGLAHAGVAGQRIGLVVPMAEHACAPRLARQGGDLLQTGSPRRHESAPCQDRPERRASASASPVRLRQMQLMPPVPRAGAPGCRLEH
ncbi:hypothetical protein FQR65_LT20133 [Abscondita terminalis]|nr:hypothetical protein FQR65_LT20133 [Abscondita terminalis]